MQLVICEKPSQARDIASAIGATKRGNGFIEGQNVIVTWCIGHLVTHAPMDLYDEKLKKWSLDTLPFIPESFRLEPVSTAKSQFKVVKDLLKDSKITDIVNATDAGREGELIFDLVYRKSGCKKNTLRLWTASLTKEAILDAWRNLKPSSDYSSLRDAARCRAESDWIIGLNATRAQTVVARSNGHKGVYSVGRVQTPTLAMIVNREHEINNFVSKVFYTLHANFDSKKGSYEGQWFQKDDKSINRFFKEEEARNLIEKIKNATAKIDSIETKTEKKKAPLLFDLTCLQREANQRFGMTAAETLSIAQSLYETHKVLSYPRTNSRYLTKGEGDKLPEILGSLKQDSRYTEFSQYITGKSTPPRFVNDKKVEDHHAIIPTGSVVNNLSDSEQKIFNMVALRSFAAFYEDRIDEVTRIVTLIGSEPFLLDFGQKRSRQVWR